MQFNPGGAHAKIYSFAVARLYSHMAKAQDYEKTLHDLQVELVKLQNHVIARGQKVLMILEGRDGAGKDGTIKRITEHLSPRDIRIIALP